MTPAQIMQDGRDELKRYKLPAGWVLNDESQELLQAQEELENLPVCGPILWSNEVHILGGDNRAGKTKFCVSLVSALVRKEEFAPGFICEIPQIRVLILDLELRSTNNVKRHARLWEEFKGHKRIWTLRPRYSEMPSTDEERVDTILSVIEDAVEASEIDLIVFDNILAWLGNKASDNDTTQRLHDGFRAMIERQNKKGRHLAVLLLAHLTKEAQKNRLKSEAPFEVNPADIRGSGGLQSGSAVVMELRPSQAAKEQTILMLHNTRHAKPENLAEHFKGYAFKTSHEVGNWSHSYLDIVDLKHHFGPNANAAPIEVKQAGNFDASTIDQLHQLHREGHSYSEMERIMRKRQPDRPVNRKAIGEYFRNKGWTPNKKQFGKK